MASLTGIASLSEDESEEDLVDLQKQLVSRVFKQVSTEDLLTIPIELLRIDWEKIKCGGMTKAQLKSAWEGILSKERLYRTGGDILCSFMENPHKQCNSTVRNWNQKYLNVMNSNNSADLSVVVGNVEETGSQENHLVMLKDKKNLTVKENALTLGSKKNLTVKEKKELKEELKKYPHRPRSSYQLYCQEKLKTHKMSEIASLWKSLDDEEKTHYNYLASESAEEYLKNLEKFVEDHPDDEYAKDLLKKASTKAHPKPKNAKRVNASDESIVSMRSPKKKKKEEKPRKEWTGFDVFVERKKEEIAVENPDLDEEKILEKLKKKYDKLNDSRREKYVKTAQELNEEG